MRHPESKLQVELDSAKTFQEGHDAGLAGQPKGMSEHQLVYDAGYAAGQRARSAQRSTA